MFWRSVAQQCDYSLPYSIIRLKMAQMVYIKVYILHTNFLNVPGTWLSSWKAFLGAKPFFSEGSGVFCIFVSCSAGGGTQAWCIC